MDRNEIRRGFPYLLIALLILCGYALHEGASLSVDKSSVTMVYGDSKKVLPSFKASLFGSDASKMVSISDDVDPETVGSYQAVYQLSLLGVPLRKVTVPVDVVDMDAPVLEMEDGLICFSRLHEEWTYPSFTVKDNYDAPEDVVISLEGDADNNQEGIYNAKLKACDSSGNCTMRSLTVVVSQASDQDFIPENFSLYDLDTAGVLLHPDAEDYSPQLFEQLYWMGDSNIMNMGVYGGLPANRVLSRYAMAPESFDKPLTYNNIQYNYNAVEFMSIVQPKYLILSMGEAEAGTGDPIRFAQHYGECVDALLKANPGMKLYVSAILPIRKGSTEAAATQEQINRANYCLLKMCEEKKLPMICADSWLKDSTGYGYDDYYLEDGFHLAGHHFVAYTDYVKYCLKEEN